LLKRANFGNLRERVNSLNAELAARDRQKREADAQLYSHKHAILQLTNRVGQLEESLQSKEATIGTLEQEYKEQQGRVGKLEEQVDEVIFNTYIQPSGSFWFWR
jgi:chromosome segregation ATPase